MNSQRCYQMIFCIILCVFIHHTAFGKSIRDAYEAYGEGKFDEASKGFLEAEIDDPDQLEYTYNRAVSQFKAGNFKGAKEGFAKSANSENSDLAQKSLFNLGNTQVELNELEDAVKSYEKLLEMNANDREARENLEWVKKKLQEQKQQDQQKKDDKKEDNKDQQKDENQQKQDQQKQDQNKKQDQQKQEEQQKQEQQKQDQNKTEEQQKQDQQKQDQQKQEEQKAESAKAGEQKEQKPEPEKMDKAEAEKLLRAIEDKVPQYRLKSEKNMHEHNGRDW